MGHAQLLPVGVRCDADVAVAAADADGLARGLQAIMRLYSLLQRHQGGRAALAVHIQLGVSLERLQGQLRAIAEVAVTAPGAQVVVQLQQHLLHQLHIVALAAVLDDAVAQVVVHGIDRPLILATVREHDDGVSAGLGDQDVTPAQVRGLALVLAAGELGERAGLGEVAGHVARPEAAGQAGDACVSDTHAHQRGAVRLTGLGHLGNIEAEGLGLLVQRVPGILVVADLAVLAGHLHAPGDLLRYGGILGPVHPPALGMEIPILGADLLAGLVSCLASTGLSVFIDPRASYLDCHNNCLLHKIGAAVIHRRPGRSCRPCPCRLCHAAAPAPPGACPGWEARCGQRSRTGRAPRCSCRSRSPRL